MLESNSETEKKLHIQFLYGTVLTKCVWCFIKNFSNQQLKCFEYLPKINIIISRGWILLTSKFLYLPVISTVTNSSDLCKICCKISFIRCRGSKSWPRHGVKLWEEIEVIDGHVLCRKSTIGPFWNNPSDLAFLSCF